MSQLTCTLHDALATRISNIVHKAVQSGQTAITRKRIAPSDVPPRKYTLFSDEERRHVCCTQITSRVVRRYDNAQRGARATWRGFLILVSRRARIVRRAQCALERRASRGAKADKGAHALRVPRVDRVL